MRWKVIVLDESDLTTIGMTKSIDALTIFDFKLPLHDFEEANVVIFRTYGREKYFKMRFSEDFLPDPVHRIVIEICDGVFQYACGNCNEFLLDVKETDCYFCESHIHPDMAEEVISLQEFIERCNREEA